MSEYVIAPPAPPSLAVWQSSSRFPLRRVFCVGRNYAAHAREMGNDPDREPPFFFCKPADAVVPATGDIPYPPLTSDLHHEVELVIGIGQSGQNITPEAAADHIWGATVGLDLTRRDLQAQAKQQGRPWDWAKAFDASAPCGPLRPVSALGRLDAGRIWLSVNGETRQEGDLADMIWSVGEVIAHCSRSVRLQPGDLIFTGTPAGVGPVQPGETVQAGIDGVGELMVRIGQS